jgi:hypothetical protein
MANITRRLGPTPGVTITQTTILLESQVRTFVVARDVTHNWTTTHSWCTKYFRLRYAIIYEADSCPRKNIACPFILVN